MFDVKLSSLRINKFSLSLKIKKSNISLVFTRAFTEIFLGISQAVENITIAPLDSSPLIPRPGTNFDRDIVLIGQKVSDFAVFSTNKSIVPLTRNKRPALSPLASFFDRSIDLISHDLVM